jgi:BirA family transcriptional regulator, biotin operon repressor / biotin---[acetyl-CoA-carboxylase] ligase
VSEPEDLSAARLAAALHTVRFGRDYRLLASCASTNDEAAALAREGAEEGLVVVADAQTGGRGRLGRSWHSPPGQSLYLSILLRPAMPPWMVPPLTLLVGGVAAEVLSAAGAAPRLKWPNDVLLPVEGSLRKVAGILTEMASERERVRHVVVGIGLNVNTTGFPPELSERATSLLLATGHPFDRGSLLAQLLDAFEPAYDELLKVGPAPALARWRRHADLGRRCRIERDGAVIEGVTVDVDEQGTLHVRDDGGRIHRILSGELT